MDRASSGAYLGHLEAMDIPILEEAYPRKSAHALFHNFAHAHLCACYDGDHAQGMHTPLNIADSHDRASLSLSATWASGQAHTAHSALPLLFSPLHQLEKYQEFPLTLSLSLQFGLGLALAHSKWLLPTPNVEQSYAPIVAASKKINTSSIPI